MIYNIKGELPMPTAAERASHLRQSLRALLADYQQRLEDLLPLRQLLKGSVYELKTRCGKPSCHCASPQGPLHTSTVLSWSERGKTRLRSVLPRSPYWDERPRGVRQSLACRAAPAPPRWTPYGMPESVRSRRRSSWR